MMIALATIQGAYFLLAGVWALVHIRSFIAVTGPKTDIWLVKTVAALVSVLGIVLLIAAWNTRITPEIVLLAAASAAALMLIEIVYVVRGVISRIYLLDAAAEAVLVVLWAVAWVTQ